MKSTERHQLKDDRFVATLKDTFDEIDQRRSQVLTGLVVIVVLAAAAGGYAWWRQQRDDKASALLAEAMTVSEAPVAPAGGAGENAGTPTPPPPGSHPTDQARLQAALPKFMAAAEAYPSTAPGIAARYHAAAVLAALGKQAEAVQRYQEVIDKGGTSLYARMARLGQADVQVRLGQYDPAINTLKELSTSAKDDLPVDGILMQLGRAYALAGRKAEASQSYKRITDEFATSPYAAEARRELEALKPNAS